MTFSHLNMTANERRRQEQSTALKRFQGVQAVVTLSQLIGTVIIFYSPTYLQVPQYNCQQNANNVGGQRFKGFYFILTNKTMRFNNHNIAAERARVQYDMMS